MSDHRFFALSQGILTPTKGYVEMPNVNIMEEMVNLMSANRSYEANTAAFNATKNMVQSALDLGRNA